MAKSIILAPLSQYMATSQHGNHSTNETQLLHIHRDPKWFYHCLCVNWARSNLIVPKGQGDVDKLALHSMI